MREMYERFVSCLNLDLGLVMVMTILCFSFHWPTFTGLSAWFQTTQESLTLLLLVGSLPWGSFMWLSLVNEMQCPLLGLFYAGFPLLFLVVVAQYWRIYSTPATDWSMAVHQILIFLMGLFALVGRMYLGKCTFEVTKYFGRGFKSHVNRLRYFDLSDKLKHGTRDNGVRQYGTLCG
mmetsp:Transcript_27024/g.47804  ORF Transcript_27024/g.47804 Transcript_27024/m.47804 type:complete len:177 (+) Transcript_27024:36-566(+)